MHDAGLVTSDPQPSPAYRNGKLSTVLGATFYDALGEMAEKLRQRIIGLVDELRFPYVHHLAQNSSIVFGVWPDPEQPSGFGFHLIKGRRHLAALSGEPPDEMATIAVPCVGREQAIAAEALWGNAGEVAERSEVSAAERKKPMRSPKKRRTSKRSPKSAKGARRRRS